MRLVLSAFLSATLLAVALACGGGSKNDTPAPPVITAPTIATFTASASAVDYGQPVTLGWTLGGSAPTSVMVNTTTLSTTATSTTVTPVARQTYTLTVTNSAGTVSKAVSVVSKGVTAFSTTNISFPGTSMAKDPTGNIYTVDSSTTGKIYKITPAGVVSVFSNTPNVTSIAWDAHTNSFMICTYPGGLYHVDLNGVKTTYMTSLTLDTITVAKDGTVYAVDENNLTAHAITVINPNGSTSTITGDNEFFPGKMVLDATESNLYVMGSTSGSTSVTVNGIPATVLTHSNLIHKIDLTTKQITTVAGQFNVKGHADGIGTAATFQVIGSATLSNDGTALYLTDIHNGLIRKMVLATGQVSTVAGSLLAQPYVNSVPFQAGTYANAVFTPKGIVQNANGDLVFAQAASTSGIIVATPICIVTL